MTPSSPGFEGEQAEEVRFLLQQCFYNNIFKIWTSEQRTVLRFCKFFYFPDAFRLYTATFFRGFTKLQQQYKKGNEETTEIRCVKRSGAKIDKIE